MFLAITAGAVIWLFVIRDEVYAPTAKVLVKLGREQAPPASVVGATPLVVGYRSQDLNSEIDIFQSSELLAKVVDKYGLDKPRPPDPVPVKLIPRMRHEAKRLVRRIREWQEELFITVGLRDRLSPREKIIFLLQKSLTVTPQRDSNVFVAKLGSPVRVGSAAVLEAVLDEYQDFRLKLFETRGIEVFRSEVDRNWKELDKSDRLLQDFEKAGDITVLFKQQEVLLEQAAQANKAAKDAEAAYLDAASKVERLDRELKQPSPNLGSLGEFERESFPQNILRQLADLEKDRQKLLMTDLENSERVVSNRSQFQVLANMLAANLRSVLAERKAAFELRKASLDTFEKELKGLHDKQMEWSSLKRKSLDYEGAYSFYRRKLEETMATTAMDKSRISNVAIIEHPMDPLQPEGMRKTALLGLSLAVALIASLAWVTIAEFFDHRVYSSEDLEQRLRVPVLSVVPRGKLEKVELERTGS